jgi:hypothetical protein
MELMNSGRKRRRGTWKTARPRSVSSILIHFVSANFWTTLAPAAVASVISSRLPTP